MYFDIHTNVYNCCDLLNLGTLIASLSALQGSKWSTYTYKRQIYGSLENY